MRKIVHVITNRPHGGIGAVLKNIVTYSSSSQFQYSFLFSEDYKECSFDHFMKDRGYNVCVLPKLNSLSNILKYVITVYRYYLQNAGDIVAVHVHTPNVAFIHLFFAWKFGIKIRIAHSHSTRYSDNWLKGICNYLLICLMKIFVTDRFACGNDAANFLFGKHNLSNTYIFHNAIDTSIFQFSVDRRRNKRKDLNLTGNLVFGHVGNMFKLKNHSFLIDVFVSIKKRYSNAVLLLVGDGALRDDLQEKVNQLGLEDSVRFLGQRDDVADILMALDVFLFPSLFEGFPVSLMEAQCTGLPCLVSDTITREVAITDLVHFLPIHEGVEALWVKELERIKLDSRRDYSQVLQTAGYDLPKEVKALETHYQKLCHDAYDK